MSLHFNALKVKVTLFITILFELIWNFRFQQLINSDSLLLTFKGPSFYRCQFFNVFYGEWHINLIDTLIEFFCSLKKEVPKSALCYIFLYIQNKWTEEMSGVYYYCFK